MRAFRPSRFAPADAYEEDDQQAREENVRRYALRAQAGMPLFESTPLTAELIVESAEAVSRK